MGALQFHLSTLALQTVLATFQEREPRATWMSLLFMGVPTLVLATVTIIVV
jgi:hypothetical protein